MSGIGKVKAHAKTGINGHNARPFEGSRMTTADSPVRSPCVHVCALDEQDICIGCQRSAAEITRWMSMSDSERREVLLRCSERARAGGAAFLT